MKPTAKKTPHKLGANAHDPAVKSHKRDPNFKQSRDVREDRGERQIKTGSASRTWNGAKKPRIVHARTTTKVMQRRKS